MSRRIVVSVVFPALATVLLPLQANAQSAANHDSAPSPAAQDAGIPVEEKEREAAMRRIQTLEVAPLLDADVQVFFVGHAFQDLTFKFPDIMLSPFFRISRVESVSTMRGTFKTGRISCDEY